MCDCKFDPRHADEEDGKVYESVHYHRKCLFCGFEWAGLHCVHDGYQNPCRNCSMRPETIPDPD